MAEEQLEQVTIMASERLQQLTRHRYALELDSQGGFLIRDDANGGAAAGVDAVRRGNVFDIAVVGAGAVGANSVAR